jgi:hypothetical protein
MPAISDKTLASWSAPSDLGYAIRELEETLAPMVRLALGKGVGLPEVVQWVQETYAVITEGAAPAPPEYYVPQITRLLCAQWQ